jgi:hypothetical protein
MSVTVKNVAQSVYNLIINAGREGNNLLRNDKFSFNAENLNLNSDDLRIVCENLAKIPEADLDQNRKLKEKISFINEGNVYIEENRVKLFDLLNFLNNLFQTEIENSSDENIIKTALQLNYEDKISFDEHTNQFNYGLHKRSHLKLNIVTFLKFGYKDTAKEKLDKAMIRISNIIPLLDKLDEIMHTDIENTFYEKLNKLYEAILAEPEAGEDFLSLLLNANSGRSRHGLFALGQFVRQKLEKFSNDGKNKFIGERLLIKTCENYGDPITPIIGMISNYVPGASDLKNIFTNNDSAKAFMKVLKWNINYVDQFLDKFVKTCEIIITNQSRNDPNNRTKTNCYQHLKGMLNHDVKDLNELDFVEKDIFTELKEKFSNIIKFDKKKKSK